MEIKTRLVRFRTLIIYGAILGCLLTIMAWSRYRFMIVDHAMDLYIFLIALVFICVGIWAGLRLSAPKIIEKVTVVEIPSPQQPVQPKDVLLAEYGISAREWEVLAALSKGLSNEEIADNLCVSANTVKTHLGNLYSKLEVKRRTQAVDKARSLGLIT